MAFSINRFKSETNSGFLKPTKFEFIAGMPIGMSSKGNSQGLLDTGNKMRFWCEGSSLPGFAVATHSVRTKGYGLFETKPVFAQFQKLNLQVLSDGNGDAWRFFQTWLSLIVNHDSSRSFTTITNVTASPGAGRSYMTPYEVSYKTQYAVSGQVIAYDDQGTQKITVQLRHMFPIAVGDIPLNWNNTNQIMRIPVSFAYFDWYYDDPNNVGGAAGFQFGDAINPPALRTLGPGV
jgi:hypothetical protein